jgi:RND family efflux transporter MFP subunit
MKSKSVRSPAWLLLVIGLGSPLGAAQPYTVRGITEPVGDVVLSVSTQGVVAALPHREGDFVAAGTMLVGLNRRTEELEKARRAVQLDNLRSELARSELLYRSSGSVTQEELDRKRAEVAVAEVELEQAAEAIARRQVVTPIAGIITNLPVKVGEYCDIGRAVARVVDSREFYITSNVDPERAGHLQVDQNVALVVPGPGGAAVQVSGRVIYVAPVIDPASGLLRIRALFPNPDGAVRPGVAGVLHVPSPSTDGN